MRTICLLIVLQVAVCAQTSPKHQIIFDDQGGFTTKSEKWIAKRKAKSERRNGEAVANLFEQNMRELNHFPDWLDSIFDEVKSEYGACHDVSGLLPSMVRVTIQSGPFRVVGYPPDFLASGVAYQDGRIEIVYWSISATVGPQMAVPLLKGELRNWMWWKLHGAPREMWGKRACP